MKSSSAAQVASDPKKTFDPRVICVAPDAELAALPGPVHEIARLCDGRKSHAEIAASAQIPEAKCAAVIKKLTAIGILHQVSRRRSRAEQPFTVAEEAFFATEVAPIDECDEPFETLGDRIRARVCELMTRLRRSQQVLG